MLAGRGARIVVNDLDPAAAARVAEEIGRNGGAAIGVGASVTNREAVDQMIDRAFGLMRTAVTPIARTASDALPVCASTQPPNMAPRVFQNTAPFSCANATASSLWASAVA